MATETTSFRSWLSNLVRVSSLRLRAASALAGSKEP